MDVRRDRRPKGLGPWAGNAARLTVFLIGAAALQAQNFMLLPLSTAGVARTGFSIYNLSVFTGAATVDDAWNTALGLQGTLPRYSFSSGVSASVGFHAGGHTDSAGSFSLLYTPSYSNTQYQGSYGSTTHSLALSWDRKIAHRWIFSMSMSGVAGNFDETQFSASSQQTLASLVGAAGGVGATGQAGTDQDQSSSVATASVTSQQRSLYGGRILSAAANAGLAYAFSRRLTLSFTANGDRMQHLRQDNVSATQSAYLIPQTTSVGGGMAVSYMLSPRTTLKGSAAYTNTRSRLANTRTTTAQAELGRKLTERWYARITGGGGYILPGGGSYGARGLQTIASLAIGHHGQAHNIFGSVDRSVSDVYGVGSSAILSSSFGWNWKRRRSKWGLDAGASNDKLLGNRVAYGLGNAGYRGNCGITWSASSRTTVALQYAYSSFSAAYISTVQPVQITQHSIRMNFGWGMGSGPGTTDVR